MRGQSYWWLKRIGKGILVISLVLLVTVSLLAWAAVRKWPGVAANVLVVAGLLCLIRLISPVMYEMLRVHFPHSWRAVEWLLGAGATFAILGCWAMALGRLLLRLGPPPGQSSNHPSTKPTHLEIAFWAALEHLARDVSAKQPGAHGEPGRESHG